MAYISKLSQEYAEWVQRNFKKAMNREGVIAFILFKQLEPKLRRLSNKALRLYLYILFNANVKYGNLHIADVEDFMYKMRFSRASHLLRYLNELRREGLVHGIQTDRYISFQLTPYFDDKLIEEYRNMPYEEYLKTEHWQKIRKEALLRAGYRCQLCNAAKPLDVHHRTYERLGEERPDDVIAICRDCHERHHGKGVDME
jgi:hypothetical protein